MKKVFGLFLSLIVLMGLSACEKGYSTLTFVASGESSVTLVKVGEPFDISLEYSMDGKNWKPYTIGETIFLLEDKLSFRAEESGNKRFSKGDDDYYQFVFSGEIAARGSIMSLLDRNCGKNAVPSYAFVSLFCECTTLTEAPELPATELAESCYSDMFFYCTSLTKAPELPAKELAPSCYAFMLKGCESLTKAPTLPAKELAENCYKGMFSLCHNLSYIKALFVTPPFGSHFDYRHPYSPLGVYSDAWLWNVARTGTFVKSKDATWDVKDCGIPEGWTVVTE